MLQLTQKTSPVLPSAARAGQSKIAQPPPPRSLVHLPATAPLVPAVLRRRPQQACPSPLPARVPHQQVPESPVMATSPPRPHSSHPVFRSATTCWALVSKHQGNVTNQTAPASALAELTFKTGEISTGSRLGGRVLSAREGREPRARGHCFKRTTRKALSAETKSQPPATPGLQEHPNPSLDLLCSTQAQGSHPSRGALHHTTPSLPHTSEAQTRCHHKHRVPALKLHVTGRLRTHAAQKPRVFSEYCDYCEALGRKNTKLHSRISAQRIRTRV